MLVILNYCTKTIYYMFCNGKGLRSSLKKIINHRQILLKGVIQLQLNPKVIGEYPYTQIGSNQYVN